MMRQTQEKHKLRVPRFLFEPALKETEFRATKKVFAAIFFSLLRVSFVELCLQY